jgi:hypothetical protein
MIRVPNFRDFCEAACIKLWGEPNKRTPKELCWHGSNSYDGKTFDRKKRFGSTVAKIGAARPLT